VMGRKSSIGVCGSGHSNFCRFTASISTFSMSVMKRFTKRLKPLKSTLGVVAKQPSKDDPHLVRLNEKASIRILRHTGGPLRSVDPQKSPG